MLRYEHDIPHHDHYDLGSGGIHKPTLKGYRVAGTTQSTRGRQGASSAGRQRASSAGPGSKRKGIIKGTGQINAKGGKGKSKSGRSDSKSGRSDSKSGRGTSKSGRSDSKSRSRPATAGGGGGAASKTRDVVMSKAKGAKADSKTRAVVTNGMILRTSLGCVNANIQIGL